MEILDLYTKDRIKTDKTMIRGTDVPKNHYRLIVHICIFNSKGELLIQQRQPFKSGWPNLWDVTVGGSATHGDSSEKAAERELLEELGYELSFKNIRPALTINFNEGFDDIYILEKDIDISKLTLQPEEVQSVKWATKEEIYKLLDENMFIPYHKSFIDLVFFMRNHNGTHTRNEK